MSTSRFRFETESCGCFVSLTPAALKMTVDDFLAMVRDGSPVDHHVVQQIITTATRALLNANSQPDYMRGWSAAGRC
jgi:hypothetical protein